VRLWVDAQISPSVARWIHDTFGVEASTLKELGLRDAEDLDIFFAARAAGATVMTKDEDFADLVLRHGPPPQIVWIRSGNTSTTKLRQILAVHWTVVQSLLDGGESLVEVADRNR
jgi:predicted nuclease of predicted toxin-antitoxin system